MRKASRIALRILGGLIVLILLVVGVSYVVSSLRLRKHYAVVDKAVAVPTDSAALARGKALGTLYGCTGCHTADLAGQTMIDAFPMARLASANLTRGQGGIGAQGC